MDEDYELVDWNGVKIDKKIFPLIKWLNDSGYKTTFCCSGHLLKLKILHTDDVNNERFGEKYLYERKDQLSYGYIMFDRRYPKIERLFKNYGMMAARFTKSTELRRKSSIVGKIQRPKIGKS